MLELFALKVVDAVKDEVLEQLSQHIEPYKRNDISRMRLPEHRTRKLFSELLIRHIIMKRTHMENHELSFVKNEFGKPFLEFVDGVYFNISHSGTWIVAALDDRPVGTDVEHVQPIDFDICTQFFSHDENDDLMEKEDKLSYFFTLWTLKESFIKFIGKGLGIPLNCFSIKYFSAGRIAILVEGKPVGGVWFRPYDLDVDYKMAVCAGHDQFPTYFHTVTVDQLLERFM